MLLFGIEIQLFINFVTCLKTWYNHWPVLVMSSSCTHGNMAYGDGGSNWEEMVYIIALR